MKKQIFNAVLTLLFLINHASFSQDTLSNRKPEELSLKDAIEKGMVELNIFGAYDPRMYYEVINQDGIHYGKCMLIILRSKIDTLVNLRLDCGTQLIPEDSSVQTMIVTQKVTFPLDPSVPYASKFYAMCGQLHDAAPNIQCAFSIGEVADSAIVKLATYLGENHLQNMPGQHALWAVTDGATFEELEKYGADSLSIKSTKEILYHLDLETKLTPRKITVPQEMRDEISINRYYLYTVLGLLFLTSMSIVILIVKRKNKKDLPA